VVKRDPSGAPVTLKAGRPFHDSRSSALIGKLSDTFARSMIDRVGDRSERAYAHDFTNTLRTKRVRSLVGLIDK